MKKEMWVLTIRTSLPEVAYDYEDVKMTNFIFESFEEAKKVLREKWREFAFTENSMFDGEGGIIYMKKFSESLDDKFDEDKESLSLSKMKKLEQALLSIFEGKDEKLPMEEVKCCAHFMIALDVMKDSIKMYGHEDGPINGYDPEFATNMFDMREEKDYYFYINDRFNKRVTSELYIDLKKAEVR